MDTLHPGWEVKVFDSTVGRLNPIEFQAKQRAALAPSPGVSEMCVFVWDFFRTVTVTWTKFRFMFCFV